MVARSWRGRPARSPGMPDLERPLRRRQVGSDEASGERWPVPRRPGSARVVRAPRRSGRSRARPCASGTERNSAAVSINPSTRRRAQPATGAPSSSSSAGCHVATAAELDASHLVEVLRVHRRHQHLPCRVGEGDHQVDQYPAAPRRWRAGPVAHYPAARWLRLRAPLKSSERSLSIAPRKLVTRSRRAGRRGQGARREQAGGL